MIQPIPKPSTPASIGAIADSDDTVKENHLDLGTGANQIEVADFPGELTTTQHQNIAIDGGSF